MLAIKKCLGRYLHTITQKVSLFIIRFKLNRFSYAFIEILIFGIVSI